MAAKNQAQKCTQEVRKIPLERFRLASDGRKWKQACRSRKAVLIYLSSYANADGSFVRDGRNYSPSLKTILKDFSRGSYCYNCDALRDLGLLSWTREDHYERRVYVIHLPSESVPTFGENQFQDSPKSVPTFADERQNQFQHSQKSVPTSEPNPSCVPSEEPSKEREPSFPSAPENPKALSRSQESSKPSTDDLVNRMIQVAAKRGSHSNLIKFSKTSKIELREAIEQLGGVTEAEISYAVGRKLQAICEGDNVARSKFGTDLASDLVGTILNRREQLVAEKKEQAALQESLEREAEECSDLFDAVDGTFYLDEEGKRPDTTGKLRLDYMEKWIADHPQAAQTSTAFNLICKIRARAAQEAVAVSRP